MKIEDGRFHFAEIRRDSSKCRKRICFVAKTAAGKVIDESRILPAGFIIWQYRLSGFEMDVQCVVNAFGGLRVRKT